MEKFKADEHFCTTLHDFQYFQIHRACLTCDARKDEPVLQPEPLRKSAGSVLGRPCRRWWGPFLPSAGWRTSAAAETWRGRLRPVLATPAVGALGEKGNKTGFYINSWPFECFKLYVYIFLHLGMKKSKSVKCSALTSSSWCVVVPPPASRGRSGQHWVTDRGSRLPTPSLL